MICCITVDVTLTSDIPCSFVQCNSAEARGYCCWWCWYLLLSLLLLFFLSWHIAKQGNLIRLRRSCSSSVNPVLSRPSLSPAR